MAEALGEFDAPTAWRPKRRSTEPELLICAFEVINFFWVKCALQCKVMTL